MNSVHLSTVTDHDLEKPDPASGNRTLMAPSQKFPQINQNIPESSNFGPINPEILPCIGIGLINFFKKI